MCISTGFGPSKLLFGVEQRRKISDNIKDFLESKFSELRTLEEICEEASAKMESEQEKN